MGQPLKFLVVGTGGYVINLIGFYFLYQAQVIYQVASVVSYIIANFLMYFGNRYYTFQLGHEGLWSALTRYLVVGLLVAGLTVIVLVMLVDVGGLHPMFGQGLALLLVAPIAFTLFKRWTFQM